VLYDLVGKNNVAFSPFCFRVKGVLAYKKLSSSVVPLNFIKIKDSVASSGQSLVPVIKDGDSVVSDSFKIVSYLEEKYPENAIFDGSETVKSSCQFYVDFCDKILMRRIFLKVIGSIWDNIVEEDRDYFRKTREAYLGTTIEDLIQRSPEAEEPLKKILGFLEVSIHGEYLLGKTFTFADIALWGSFKFPEALDPTFNLESFPNLQAWYRRVNDKLSEAK